MKVDPVVHLPDEVPSPVHDEVAENGDLRVPCDLQAQPPKRVAQAAHTVSAMSPVPKLYHKAEAETAGEKRMLGDSSLDTGAKSHSLLQIILIVMNINASKTCQYV